MRLVGPHSRRARTGLLGALALLLAIALALALGGATPGPAGVSRAAGPSAEVTAQTDDSVPALGVRLFGSSPAEEPGETWGIGEVGGAGSSAFAVVRYTGGATWTLAPASLDASGQPLSEFQPAATPLTGEMTPGGDGVLVGTVPGQPTRRQVLLVRGPGGAFRETARLPTSGEAALNPEESLYDEDRTPLIAPLDEGGHAGALVAPVSRAAGADEERVLHWNGEEWSSEPIELPLASKAEGGFRVLAIGASSTTNAWLLAQLSKGSGDVALFRRESGHWTEVTPAPLAVGGAPLSIPGTGGGEPVSKAQILTVTAEGVWIDGERSDIGAPVTMYFKPESETADSGSVLGSWCDPGKTFSGCEALPQALPTGPSRSFAWANSSPSTPFGERVITGLGEGVSLRLEGSSFVRVLALGGSAPPNDVGGTFGAAFSSPLEGWLGNGSLPVHLTLHPAPDRLSYYPVPFRHALTAIASQPGAPVGSLSSEALAVGDLGEVARYLPGEGWEPESLLGPGGVHETPRLRAVAWPTPTRAYAVGELGQMWLWRAETGLWEADPATPLNFQGNLLGIAFDPANPSRGYAVGQQGVLLRYGKTWTQEPEAALPAEAQGASFTSVAFAGSEAIVAFRKIHLEGHGEGTHYTGGVLVNSGAGWQIDERARQALGGQVPWAVAGLPDGGAAISASFGGLEGTPLILERQSAEAPWQPTPEFYPGGEAPGSLALFREGGALRAVGAGGLPETMPVEDQRPPPAGFPPNLIAPYPLAQGGPVIRQTSSGWQDEEHQQNSAVEPLGEYKLYDQVYQPDPSAAVLIDATGTLGWAVGGFVDETHGALDTADVARYPADGVTPPGLGTAPIQATPGLATFAVGGGAQCQASCADRANAGIGPDAWLSRALEQARQTAGVRAFLYTGPRVTSGAGHGTFPVPYSREFARYAQLLGGSLPTYPAATSSDRGPGSECTFQEAFAGFPAPLGVGATAPGLAEGGRSSEPCSSYYALESTGSGGPVRVIVLDSSADVDATQLAFLAGQLQTAAAKGEPAIVIANADLRAQIAAGDGAAAAVAETLVDGGASAYFYDAPEQNVELPLQVGSKSIETFGSGTLGYVSSVSSQESDFIGASGFLLAQVNDAARNAKTNVAPVSARLIPNIGELALEAQEGTLLRRSQAALFAGLARRPRAGGVAERGVERNESDLYIPIPANCVGTLCANGIFPEYTFTSSDPEIGNFVEPNLASYPPTVLLGAEEKPIPDPRSGLFCAYNAGTTIVTISAGGLSSSLPVTVQAGSVRRPCGTTPLKNVPAQQARTVSPPPPSPPPAQNPPPTGPAPAPVPLPVPAPPALPATPAPPPAARPAPATPFFLPPALGTPLLAAVPPPVPTPARPTPPSGTSAVTTPVEAPEKQEEQEEAPDTVSNKAVAYRASEGEPSSLYLLGIVLLAAFAGASVRGRPRRGRREVRIAPATVNTMRAQRRMSGRGRPR